MFYNSRHKQYEACHRIYRRRLSDGSMTRTEEDPDAWSVGYRLQEIAVMQGASLYLSGIIRQVFLLQTHLIFRRYVSKNAEASVVTHSGV